MIRILKLIAKQWSQKLVVLGAFDGGPYGLQVEDIAQESLPINFF